MKKVDTIWKIFIGYLILITLVLFTTQVNAQSISEEGIVVVEFNAPFSKNKCEYLDDLNIENIDIARVDISKTPELQSKYKIVVVPTLIIFIDGEEKKRFQANIMMQLEATREEVMLSIDELLTKEAY